MTHSLRILISFCITSLLLTATQLPAEASNNRKEITKLCMAGFNAAMSQAGITPPEGMGEFTCTCFMREMKSIALIQHAQKVCKKLAADQYGPFL